MTCTKYFLLSPGSCKWSPRCVGQDPGSHLHYGGSVWLSLIKSNKLVAGICCYLQCHSHPPFLPVQFLINTRTRGSCSFHLPARTKMASCPPDVMGSWLSLHPGVTLWKKHCTKNDAQLPGQGEASLLFFEGVSTLRQVQPPHDHELRVQPTAATPQLSI